MHNPETYPEPEEFKPERFLGNDSVDLSEFAFGYGRRYVPIQSSRSLRFNYSAVSDRSDVPLRSRVCPGRWFAVEAVWIAIVSILAAFDITQAVDKEGKLKPVRVDCTAGSLLS